MSAHIIHNDHHAGATGVHLPTSTPPAALASGKKSSPPGLKRVQSNHSLHASDTIQPAPSIVVGNNNNNNAHIGSATNSKTSTPPPGLPPPPPINLEGAAAHTTSSTPVNQHPPAIALPPNNHAPSGAANANHNTAAAAPTSLGAIKLPAKLPSKAPSGTSSIVGGVAPSPLPIIRKKIDDAEHTAHSPAPNPSPKASSPSPSAPRGPQRPRFPARMSGSHDELVSRLTYYFEKYSPNLTSQVPLLIQRYGKREGDLWDSLFDKYGPEPDVPRAGLDLKTRLIAFFRKYDPKYESKVDKIMHAYAGHEDGMWKALYNQYGPEDCEAAADPSVFTTKVTADGKPMDLTSRLRRFFEKHDPPRLNSADQLSFEFASKEQELRAMLKAMYFNDLEEAPESVSRRRSQQAQQQQKGASPGGVAGKTSPGRRGGSPTPASRLEMRSWLRDFFTRHSPERTSHVDELMDQFTGREEQLFEALEASFGHPDSSGGHSFMDRLVRFYFKYEPEKTIEQIDAFREKYKGKEQMGMDMLLSKYGAEPDGPIPPYTLVHTSSASPQKLQGTSTTTTTTNNNNNNASSSPSRQLDNIFENASPSSGSRPSSGNTQSNYRGRLVSFFKQYDSSQIQSIDALLEKNRGKEDELFASLTKKHGPEPTSSSVNNMASTQNNTASSTTANQSPSGASTATSNNNKAALSSTDVPYKMPPPLNTPEIQSSFDHDQRTRLTRFYQKYDPARANSEQIDKALTRFDGKYEKMWNTLTLKYGPEPAPNEDLTAYMNSNQTNDINLGIGSGSDRASDRASVGGVATPRGDINNSNNTKFTSADYKSRLIRFYQKYEPDKANDVQAEKVLSKYAGKEETAFEMLVAKYGPEPPVATTTTTITPTPIAATTTTNQVSNNTTNANVLNNIQASSPPQQQQQQPASPSSPSGPSSPTAPMKPDFRARLVRFYRKYDPEKANDAQIDKVVAKYAGQEETCFEMLVSKYGPEPKENENQQPQLQSSQQPQPQPAVNSPPAIPPPPANNNNNNNMDYRGRLMRFYQKYEPTKANDDQISKVLVKYAGDEETCFKMLVTKYGPEPGPNEVLPATNLNNINNSTVLSSTSDVLLPSPSTAITSPSNNNSNINNNNVGSNNNNNKDYRGRLTRFYQKYEPAKANEEQISKILVKYAGDEETCFRMLVDKYGPEPAFGDASGSAATTNVAAASAGASPTFSNTTAATAGVTQTQIPNTNHKERLVAFYTKYEPAKIGNVDAALTKYAGDEATMWTMLKSKYGEEPGQEEKVKLVEFFGRKDPPQIANVHSYVIPYLGQFDVMWKMLHDKYGK